MHRLRTHRRQGAARAREDSPFRAGSPALVGKNASSAVQPADTAQYPESNATSCAVMLRECRAHGRARMGETSPGEPRPIAPFSLQIYKIQGEIKIFLSIRKDVSICANINRCINVSYVYIYTHITICIYI